MNAQANFCPYCGRPLKTSAPAYTYAPVQPVALPQKKPVNGLGIAAFVLGIVSLLLGFYLFVVSIVGIVLGAIGVARRKKYRLNGLAIAGLVISCVAFVFWFFFWIFNVFFFASALFFLFFLFALV